MTEMIDRAAKEIAAEIMELTADQRANFKFPDDANGDTIDRARSAARATLIAIRQPTKAMVDADFCRGGYGFSDGECFEADPTEVWQAMLDVALNALSAE